MLLTLKPASQNGVKGPHEYSIVRQSVPTPRSSPPPVPDLPAAVTAPSTSSSADRSMDPSRSGLPPPASLTLPPPNVGFANVSGSAMNQPLPPPPGQWQSSDDSMRQWLQAKAEEDRRKQEEEKTRQETLRLEQRRVEQSMLRDSLQAGVPPQMIPLIFAGISPGGLPASMLELTQQYLTQPSAPRGPAPQMPVMSHAHPHAQRRPTHVRQDSRTIPSNAYVAPPVHPQTVPPPGVLLSQPLHTVGASPTPQPLGRPSVSNGPADPRFAVAAIPRMNPGESQLQPPINLSNVHYAPGSSIPSTQPPRGKSDSSSRQSPPSLYFHHWVPPGQTAGHAQSGRGRQESPGAVQGSRHVDSNVSPGRKRKAHGAHHPAPLPSSRPPESFPGSSQTSQPGSPAQEYQTEQAAPPTHHHHSLPRSSDASAPYQTPAEDVKREHRSRGTSPTHSSERMIVDDARSNQRARADNEDHYEENNTSAGHATSPHTVRVQRSEAASYHDPRSSPARSPTAKALQLSQEHNLASGH
ncbi:hypothetical protein AtubIFM54640_003579 [Aspergillus tubingensis]|uniref:Similar to An02g08400 n=1 Tax=Aspergillus niger TaxID=5061 RepID=A0A124BVN2_ASPNG|nr:similar to An02g08400 [Aspergillus tubingensis]GAQ36621.1 similar to An02g08400 [Aspergillus niger]GFN14639.1 similar to An02g08400 [Aspergillus tubingensis]GLA57445.1 hypothetical protein AtubIFM54640_003579 [Aspergillus tubingensis]GLA97757.1 hypothetical protein AtubIFM57143_005687 [Aspergillus tubingensis]GLB13287.1 hypothetical protein AtubIFM61612_000693 [Aspergillus tubingensis]